MLAFLVIIVDPLSYGLSHLTSSSDIEKTAEIVTRYDTGKGGGRQYSMKHFAGRDRSELTIVPERSKAFR